MVALVLSLTGLLVLAGFEYVPGWLRVDTGIVSVEPSLLTVDPDVLGMVTLGEGFTVGASRAGLRFAHQDTVLADTVTRGAPIVALLGTLHPGDPPREDVTAVLNEVRLRSLEIRPGMAIYTGTVRGEVEGRDRILPLRWQVVRSGSTLHSTITVPGANAVVLSLDHRPNIVGIPPTLPERNLRQGSFWYAPDAPEAAAFTWFMPSVIGTGPADAVRAIDDDVDGRVDLHIWGDRATFVVTQAPEPQSQAQSPSD